MKRLHLMIASFLLSLPLSSPVLASPEENYFNSVAQITNVNQLQDVAVTDWAYEALRGLSERYGCVAGFSDQTYRGKKALTRYEFAAGLSSCLQQIEQLAAENETISRQDASILQRLSRDFETELATLNAKISDLENRVSSLEDQQFSTTTKLRGQILVAGNAGGFTGEQIIDPNNNLLTESQPEAAILYRASFDLDTSFTGTDLLKLRLATGSNGFDDNAAGILEPNFGSILDYSDSPPASDNIGLNRAYYSFKPNAKILVAIGTSMVATDFIDFNRYTKPSFRNVSTESLTQNYLLFPIEGPSAGAYTSWSILDQLTVRATYNAAEAGNPREDISSMVIGLSSFIPLLYPGGEGDGGLFGDFYQGIVELEYAPTDAVALRFQYGGGEIFDRRFDVLGLNFEWEFLPKIALFGRYSYGEYDATDFGDIQPNYWMGGLSIIDLFKEGAVLGFAAGQPFIASEIGNSTQTNLETFYNYPVSNNISVAPIIQAITNAGNQSSNDTIITGTIRTVFSFR